MYKSGIDIVRLLGFQEYTEGTEISYRINN